MTESQFHRKHLISELVAKRQDSLADMSFHFICKLWIDWNGNNFLRGFLCFREIAHRITEIPEAFLQVHRNRIIDRTTNSFILQMSDQLVPLANPDDVLIIYA